MSLNMRPSNISKIINILKIPYIYKNYIILSLIFQNQSVLQYSKHMFLSFNVLYLLYCIVVAYRFE